MTVAEKLLLEDSLMSIAQAFHDLPIWTAQDFVNQVLLIIQTNQAASELELKKKAIAADLKSSLLYLCKRSRLLKPHELETGLFQVLIKLEKLL